MSVGHKAELSTFYPDMNLDEIQDAEIVNEKSRDSSETGFDVSMVMVSDHLSKNSISFSEIEPDQANPYMVGVAFIGSNQQHNQLYLENIKKLNQKSNPEALSVALDSQAYIKTLQSAYEGEGEYFDHPTSYMIDAKGNLIWNVGNERPESVALLLVRGNGEIEQLGKGDHSTSSGVVSDIAADDELYMISNTVLESMRDTGTLDQASIAGIMEDEQFPADIIRVSFGEAINDSGDASLEATEEESDDASHMTEGQKESLTRNVVTPRQQAIRKKLGLPYDATDQEVREASKRNRLRRQNKSSMDNPEDVNDATEDSVPADKETFTVTDKRVRSRKELLFASLDQLSSDMPSDKPAPEVTGPVAPPLPDYEPTVHLKTVTDSEPEKSPDASASVEQDTWKGNLRHPLAFLASRLDAARVIHQNKLEKRYTEEQLAERNKNQEKVIKGALGAVGVALLFVTAVKLGYDIRGSVDSSAVPLNYDRHSSDPIPTEKIPAAPPTPPPEFSAAASTVTNGEGWYQTIQETTGVTDPARQAAILQKIGAVLQEKGLAYPMGDGTWGISRPGALPRDVLELIKNSQ